MSSDGGWCEQGLDSIVDKNSKVHMGKDLEVRIVGEVGGFGFRNAEFEDIK